MKQLPLDLISSFMNIGRTGIAIHRDILFPAPGNSSVWEKASTLLGAASTVGGFLEEWYDLSQLRWFTRITNFASYAIYFVLLIRDPIETKRPLSDWFLVAINFVYWVFQQLSQWTSSYHKTFSSEGIINVPYELEKMQLYYGQPKVS